MCLSAKLEMLAAAGIIATPWAGALSEEQIFDATCVTSERCRVRATGELIETSKDLTIKADDILFWSMSNNSEKKKLG